MQETSQTIKQQRPSWDKTFFDILAVLAKRSDDPNTKLGSLVVSEENDILSLGYNGLPRGIKPTENNTSRPTKYPYMVHAEENAILNAGRKGVALRGSKLYVEMFPCMNCARAIVQAGIREVVVGNVITNSGNWKDQQRQAYDLFQEAKVQVRGYNE